MSNLIQKASGLGSATFPNPTQLGSSIIVVYAVNDGSGFLVPTDDKGNIYQQDASLFNVSPNDNGSSFCTVWYCPPGAGIPITQGVKTVFGHADPFGFPITQPYVWIYEVVTNQVLPSSNAHPAPPKDISGQNFGPSNANPVGINIGAVGQNSTNPLATGDFCLAICLVQGGTVTSVDSPWTLDTVQGGNAPAYAFFSNGIHAFPQFHQASPTNWAVGMSYYTADPTSSAPNSIIIVKATNPPADPQVFTFRPSWTSPFTLQDGGVNTTNNLLAGTYSISEDAIDGWNVSVTGGDPTNIILTAGTVVTLTFTNTKTTPPPVCFADGIVPAGLINGINTSFVLPSVPNPPGSLILESDSNILAPGTGFTLTGANLVLAFPPQNSLVAWYRFTCGSIPAPVFTLVPGQLFDNNTEAINSTYFTYGFVNSAKATQNPMLGFHRKRYQEIQMYIRGEGQAQVTTYPNYILKQDLTFNPSAYNVPPIVLQTDPPDDLVRPLNSIGNRVFVKFETNAVGAKFRLSKVIMVGTMDQYNIVNPNSG